MKHDPNFYLYDFSDDHNGNKIYYQKKKSALIILNMFNLLNIKFITIRHNKNTVKFIYDPLIATIYEMLGNNKSNLLNN